MNGWNYKVSILMSLNLSIHPPPSFRMLILGNEVASVTCQLSIERHGNDEILLVSFKGKALSV